MKNYFFHDKYQLAQMFTQENKSRYGETGKFEDKYCCEYEGIAMKPIEAFSNDISNNLQQWSYDKENIYYRTKDYWYVFSPDKENKKIIYMTRFGINSWIRLDDFANLHSIVGITKEWLNTQKDKYIKLFNVIE